MRAREIQRSTAVVSDPTPLSADPVRQTQDLLEVLWRHRWIVLIAPLISIGTAIIYLRQTRPEYTSSSRIFIEQNGPKLISTNEGSYMPGGSNFLSTQCEVLKSTTITNIAVETGAFANMKSFAGLDNPVGAVKAGLEVAIGKNNDIITVSYTSPYATEAPDIVNRIVEAYTTYQDRQKKSTATEVLKILQVEQDKLQISLKEKLSAKLAFLKENKGLVLTSDKNGEHTVTPAARQLDGLYDALNVAKLATFRAKAELEFAKRTVEDPEKLRRLLVIQSAEGPNAAGRTTSTMGMISPQEQQLHARLDDLQEQFESLKGHYLPGHPTLRDMQGRIDRLSAQLGEMHQLDLTGHEAPTAGPTPAAIKRYGEIFLATAQQKMEIAELNEVELSKTVDASMAADRLAMDNGTSKVASYEAMDKDFNRTQQLSDQLQSRINEIHVTEDAGAMNVTVLEIARPSMRPSKPDRPKTLSSALVLGLVLGIGIAFAHAWMDQRLRSVDEIRTLLDVSILGGIPAISGTTVPATRGRTAHLEPKSDVAESYRTVRTSIYFGVPDSRTKTIMVTSPEPGDGKSTTASNVAITMAQAGQRTLIIDADFRRPVQHKIFTVDNKTGLATVLFNQTGIDEAIKPSGVDKLDILPCGPIPSNPAEMLNSQEFTDILSELCGRYDQIVIDSPPVIPVTDARILGAVCDMTILVLRADKSTRKAAVHARDLLRAVGSNILGVIVNAIPRQQGRYGYYYGYSYYGGYRYENDQRSVEPHRVLSNGNGNGHALPHQVGVDEQQA